MSWDGGGGVVGGVVVGGEDREEMINSRFLTPTQ